MYSLYLQTCSQNQLIGHYDDEQKIHDYINAYRASKGLADHYTRFYNEEKLGGLMTCVDFGSWSEFFYIYPVLDWMKPN